MQTLKDSKEIENYIINNIILNFPRIDAIIYDDTNDENLNKTFNSLIVLKKNKTKIALLFGI